MHKKIFFGLAAVIAVFVFLGAGCNDPTHGEGGPGPEPGKESASKGGSSEMENICKYFPKELVEEAIGRPVVKTEDSSIVTDHICIYYTVWSETYDHTPYGDNPGGAGLYVILEDKSVAANKAEFEKNGYTVKKDDSFAWDNYLFYSAGSKTAYRADLIVNENRFFRMHSTHFAVTDEEIVKIGKRFSERMKNGK